MTVLRDDYNRFFYYLRVSITELCNFNCKYCLPSNLSKKKYDYMTALEIFNLINAFSELGVKKVRITGGEPSIRNDLFIIAERIRSIQNIESLVLTSNGYKLYKLINSIKNSGFTGINISLDTLNEDKFFIITGRDYFKRVLESIYGIIEAGLKVKVNVVLSDFFSLEDFEDFYSFLKYKSIIIRFIEQMETNNIKKNYKTYISASYILEFLKRNGWHQERKKLVIDGPATLFYNSSYLGKIGIINPYSSEFCYSCNRLRISALGELFLCLFGDNSYNLRPLLKSVSQKDNLKHVILEKVKVKNKSHFLSSNNFGIINNFSSIGG